MPQAALALPIRWIAPADAFTRVAQQRGVAWLDSSLERPTDSRFSILSWNPAWQFSSHGSQWQRIWRDGRVEAGGDDALAALDRSLDEVETTAAGDAPSLPFYGGGIGWFSYDLVQSFEDIGAASSEVSPLPDAHWAWHDRAIVWDHLARKMWLVGTGIRDGSSEALAALRSQLLEPPSVVAPCVSGRRPTVHETPGDNRDGELGRPVRSNMSRTEYLDKVAAVREGIARGKYYQLNLCQTFTCPHEGEPAETYLRLREINPAPFAAYLVTGDVTILSSSPERFIEVTPSGTVRTCPIKGTRPRGRTLPEDEIQLAELQSCPKERAELLMIVDLLRNDLGRVSLPGTVKVNRLYAVESFATVHHLVGEVEGRLRPGLRRRDLLRAVFPGGSITGAPKISAMRAIHQLEPGRRGIAMGSLGYISSHGRMDLNIAIRTIVVRDGVAHIAVGAGIVWDSDPASEYAETLAKARALFAALGVSEVQP